MSHRAVDMAFDVTDIENPREHLTFLYLANFANQYGENAYPSVDTLAKWVHCSERTMQYILRRLEKSGRISPTANRRGGRMSTCYQLCFPEMVIAKFGSREQRKATFRVVRTTKRREQIDELPDFLFDETYNVAGEELRHKGAQAR